MFLESGGYKDRKTNEYICYGATAHCLGGTTGFTWERYALYKFTGRSYYKDEQSISRGPFQFHMIEVIKIFHFHSWLSR